MCELQCCALLHDGGTYNPDMLDLNKDTKAATYWFQCFRDMIAKFATQASASSVEEQEQNLPGTAMERAEQFRIAYLQKLEEYERSVELHESTNTRLGIRELLEMNETLLRRYGFTDPWLKQKKTENTAAITLLQARLEEIDAVENISQRWTELVRGVLAGNMFDWGAQAVTDILRNDTSFGLHAALDKIQKRPWLMDNLDSWLQRMQTHAHKCAVIFVDNSGVDVILGIIPFARELLRRGTKVLLCGNTEPSLNDVTYSELLDIVERCCSYCDIISKAKETQQLLVFANGQRGPCLDFRALPVELCRAITANETDLLVIEGMGRALHTNLYAKFSCETLKLAVIKNKWLANRLGGDTFSVICKYES